jgi:hypothetical protein
MISIFQDSYLYQLYDIYLIVIYLVVHKIYYLINLLVCYVYYQILVIHNLLLNYMIRNYQQYHWLVIQNLYIFIQNLNNIVQILYVMYVRLIKMVDSIVSFVGKDCFLIMGNVLMIVLHRHLLIINRAVWNARLLVSNVMICMIIHV